MIRQPHSMSKAALAGKSRLGSAWATSWVSRSLRRYHHMGESNNRILFWASFLTLIAAGMGFSVRGEILADWGHDFGFTQTELGKITGQGLAAFGVTIIFFSFFADIVGYGKLMIVAFLLHVLSVVLTLAAPFAYQHYGKDGAYACLYAGQFCFSLA